jgi:hypothetical protein
MSRKEFAVRLDTHQIALIKLPGRVKVGQALEGGKHVASR